MSTNRKFIYKLPIQVAMIYSPEIEIPADANFTLIDPSGKPQETVYYGQNQLYQEHKRYCNERYNHLMSLGDGLSGSKIDILHFRMAELFSDYGSVYGTMAYTIDRYDMDNYQDYGMNGSFADLHPQLITLIRSLVTDGSSGDVKPYSGWNVKVSGIDAKYKVDVTITQAIFVSDRESDILTPSRYCIETMVSTMVSNP